VNRGDRCWWHPPDGSPARSALVLTPWFNHKRVETIGKGDRAVKHESNTVCVAVDVVWIRNGGRERRTVPAVPCSELSVADVGREEWPPELWEEISTPTGVEPDVDWDAGEEAIRASGPERTDPESWQDRSWISQ
jgi:hypothetical protein